MNESMDVELMNVELMNKWMNNEIVSSRLLQIDDLSSSNPSAKKLCQ